MIIGVAVAAVWLREASSSRQSQGWFFFFFFCMLDTENSALSYKLRAGMRDSQSNSESLWPEKRKPKAFCQTLVMNAGDHRLLARTYQAEACGLRSGEH